MFTKKYFQDRPVLFLHIAIIGMGLLSIISSIIRVDTTKVAAIVRYEPGRGFAGYTRGEPLDLYVFIVGSIIIIAVAVLLSAKLYSMQRALSISLLSLSLVVMIFMFVASNALYNLQ